MRLLKRFCVLILGLAMPLAMPSVVRADAVTDWNAIAVQTIVNAGPTHGSAVGFLDNATVQIAVYDAVEAIDGRFKPYHVHIPGASGSPAARRQRRVSLLSGQMTGASHPIHRPSRVALLPASGARRLHTSPDHLQLSLPR